MTLINKEDKIFIAGGRGMVGSAIKRKLNNLGFKYIISPNSSELLGEIKFLNPKLFNLLFMALPTMPLPPAINILSPLFNRVI